MNPNKIKKIYLLVLLAIILTAIIFTINDTQNINITIALLASLTLGLIFYRKNFLNKQNTEITPQKNNTDELDNNTVSAEYLYHILNTMNKVHRLLFSNKPQYEIAQGMCEILLTHANYSLVWIGDVMEEQVLIKYYACNDDLTLTSLSVSLEVNEDNINNASVQSVLQNRTTILQQIDSDYTKDCVKQSDNISLSSVIAIPIRDADDCNPFAVITIFSSKNNDFIEDDVRMLESLARDIGRVISDRRKRKDLLNTIEKSNKLKWLILDGMTNGVIVYKAISNCEDFQIVSVNAATEKMEELTRKEMLGKFATDVFPSIVSFGLFDILKRVYFTGIQETIPLKLYQNEKTSSWREYYVYKLESGEVVTIYEDSTALKETEQASAAKSQFLANMSHEIRTPLNSIISMSHLLANSDIEKKEAKYVDTITASSQALLALINDILDFSKIEAGKVELLLSEFSIDELLTELHDIFATKVYEKNIAFSFIVDANIPDIIIGDRQRLKQILFNFISNAIKFTKKGKITLFLKQRNIDSSSITIEFGVQDSGIGVTELQISKLFQAFEQADSSTTRVYGGTGLGLAICKSLTTLMNGEIGVKSIMDSGSYFYAIIPLEYKPQCSILRVNEDKRIQIIDNDTQYSNHILHLLQNAGLKCIVSNIKQIHNQTFNSDCVIICTNSIDEDVENKYLKSNKKTKTVVISATYSQYQTAENTIIIEQAQSRMQTFENIILHCGNTYKEHTIEQKDKTQPSLNNIKILVVDDIDINLFVMNELLTQYGAMVTTAASGQEAINILQLENQTFDIVLLDLQMPYMDGFETAKHISELGLKNFKLYALSADITGVAKEKTKNKYFNGYLSKPVEPNLLIKHLLNEHKALESTINSTQLYEEFKHFKAIDSIKGLELLGGNKTAYIQALKKFEDRYKSCAVEIRQMLENNNQNEIKSILHTLKGLSGNLGIINIFELLKSNHQADMQFIEIFEIELSEAIKDIELIPILKQKSEIQNISIEKLQNLLKKVSTFQISAKDDAVFLNSKIEQTNPIKEDFANFCNALEQYDFTLAKKNLQSIIAKTEQISS